VLQPFSFCARPHIISAVHDNLLSPPREVCDTIIEFVLNARRATNLHSFRQQSVSQFSQQLVFDAVFQLPVKKIRL
jgi:hypothetical protein